MTGSFLALLALGALLASAAMTCLWAIQVRSRDASHVDVGWATGIAVLAVVYALLANGSAGHRVLAAGLATIWGWRLGLYLLRDRVLGKEEDGRYRVLREKWSARADRSFFLFFQFQALFVVFFRVTGIPATEAQALRSRADYADYQRTTSVFVPLPPRADDARNGGLDRRVTS